MKRSDLVRLRLDNQRLTRPSCQTPSEVVGWLGAVQSQDLPASLYAIGLRIGHATQAVVEQALADRSIVRSWPMRRTIHCMAADDARWMIRLLAPRGIVRMQPYHRKLGITHDHLRRAGRVFETVLAGDKQLTRAELYQCLRAARIPLEMPHGLPLGMHLLCHWAQAGLICIAARRESQPTFALLDEWTPRGRDLCGDDALAELARRYFQSHGPATVNDFAWWASLPVKEAKRAVQLAGALLRSVEVDGVEYWLLRDTSPASSTPLPVLLLPPFDEYTVAYADRTLANDPSTPRSPSHGLAPNILIQGRIAGTWKRTLFAIQTVAISPTLLRILNRKEQTGLAGASERYAEFLGKALARENGPRRPHVSMRKGKRKP